VHSVTFDMHRDDGLVVLADILRAVPANDWMWHVLEFEGIGIAPNDMSMAEFETIARARGYPMDWTAFTRFARDAEQSWWCTIAALDHADPRRGREIIDSDFAHAHVVLEAFDSSTWTIRSASQSITSALIERYRR
jgi:hypothetical protein